MGKNACESTLFGSKFDKMKFDPYMTTYLNCPALQTLGGPLWAAAL